MEQENQFKTNKTVCKLVHHNINFTDKQHGGKFKISFKAADEIGRIIRTQRISRLCQNTVKMTIVMVDMSALDTYRQRVN